MLTKKVEKDGKWIVLIVSYDEYFEVHSNGFISCGIDTRAGGVIALAKDAEKNLLTSQLNPNNKAVRF